MAGPRRRGEAAGGAWLSIGALSRATGIAVETLRTWESRYGVPVPRRKPSGHRVYPVASVARLRRVGEALALGHRAGQVVAASDDALAELLEKTAAPPRPLRATIPPSVDLHQLLELVERFDADRLTRVLLADWGRLGPLDFLERRVAPLVRAVGDAWEEGRLEIRHEHFLSERVGDLLRSLRLPFEERAQGPLVVFASLPGEAHALGLQIASLLLASEGCRVLYLGTEVPLPQVAALARDLDARVVAISVSLATRGPASGASLRRLRALLPRRVILLVGGDGAPRGRPGLEVIQDLPTLHDWGRRIGAGGSPDARSGPRGRSG